MHEAEVVQLLEDRLVQFDVVHQRFPASQRVLSILEMRRAASMSDWIFPPDTESGHIEASTLKKRHSAAVVLAKVAAFVPDDMRHTCLTRWAKVLDPFTLKKLAGHADLNTTIGTFT